MKLGFLSFDFSKFASEMQNLKDKKGFDYLVTIVGEDLEYPDSRALLSEDDCQDSGLWRWYVEQWYR